MAYLEKVKQENENIYERYQLAMERIESIKLDSGTVAEKYRDYFQKVASFLLDIKKMVTRMENGTYRTLSLSEWENINDELYRDLMPEDKTLQGAGYEFSYANPGYAKERLGETYAGVLCFLYTELRGCVAYAFEQRLFDITIGLELFIEIFNLMEEEEENTLQEIRQAIYYYVSDYCDVTIPKRIGELLDPSFSFFTEIIMESDLEDLRYLYRFGEYVSENEIKIAKYLNSLSMEQIESMAHTYTEGYRKGFEVAGIDLSKKKTVNIRYCLGFERIVKTAIEQFRQMGLEPVIYRSAVSSIHKKINKTGFYGTSVNRQYDYDHRYDHALYLDKAFQERKLVHLRLAYEEYAQWASVYAGPAVMEIFGEEMFQPKNQESACKLSEKQRKLSVEYERSASLLVNEFIPSDQYSFTIIAYPIPEIGKDFDEIFCETVKVNTLDPVLYEKIQQTMIDVLDQGEYVKIIGKGKNKTNLTIQLPPLKNPEKETNFENCLADVNIPVGEVFTSPQLEGTYGLLHVTEVYLNDLQYKDLELEFEEGKIRRYTCKNFSSEGEKDTEEIKKQNEQFVKENLMYQRETLPIGEFAIGTNTTAYAMGKRFGISHKLPILIAEKTGPHFAVGDTCYSMSEEKKVYNPDGKEIVAKDNSCSILRKTDMEKAYFNCHTDITIPYDELQEITVYNKAGEGVSLIRDGRFVLEGTTMLNQALDGVV